MRSRLPWRGPASRRRSPGWRGAWWVLPSTVAAPDGVGPGGAWFELGIGLDRTEGNELGTSRVATAPMRLSGQARIGSAVRLYYVTLPTGRRWLPPANRPQTAGDGVR